MVLEESESIGFPPFFRLVRQERESLFFLPFVVQFVEVEESFRRVEEFCGRRHLLGEKK